MQYFAIHAVLMMLTLRFLHHDLESKILKTLKQITLSVTVALGLGTLAYLQASPRTRALPASLTAWRKAPSTPLSELAAPLLHRDFTSTCLNDKNGFYRETLRFADNATTT